MRAGAPAPHRPCHMKPIDLGRLRSVPVDRYIDIHCGDVVPASGFGWAGQEAPGFTAFFELGAGLAAGVGCRSGMCGLRGIGAFRGLDNSFGR